MTDVADLLRATRGIPAHHALAVLGEFTPGVNWAGCTSKRRAFESALRERWLPQPAALAFLARIAGLRCVASEVPGEPDWAEARRQLHWRSRREIHRAR